MDEKDFRILVELADNARQSLQALGRRVGLSAPSVRDRLRHLEERGVLQGYWVSIDPAVFGRKEVILYFDGEWSRERAASLLELKDAAWAAWKYDGGVSLQLWVEDADAAAAAAAAKAGRAPAWRSVTESGWKGALSPADWRILDALIDAPTAPVEELAAIVRLSPKTVRRRIAQMAASHAIYVVARLGYGKEPGDLVYDLLVSGTAPFAEVHRAVGDAALIHQTDDPPRMYMMCRSPSLGAMTRATKAVEALPGVTDARVALNRELILARGRHHEFVRAQLGAAPRARP